MDDTCNSDAAAPLEGETEKYKRVEAKLRASEARWHTLAGSTSDYIMLLGLDMKILSINRTVPDLKKSDVIGKHVSDFVPADYRDTASKKFESALRTGNPQDYKTTYVTVDGKTQFFDVRLSPVIQDGEVVSVISSSNNVTGHGLAERALHRLATTFSALSGEEYFFEVAKCLSETLDMKHAFVGELKAEEQRIKVVGGSVEGRPVPLPMEYDLAGTPCEQVFAQSFCLHKSGTAQRYPEDVLLADLCIEAYVGTPLFDRFGAPLGILMALDTKPIENAELVESLMAIFAETVAAEMQRRHVEEALRKSEALLSDAGRMAKVGGWELDIESRQVSWTKEAYRIHELSPDQSPPLDGAINYCYADDRPAFNAAVEQAIDHGKAYDLEIRMVTAKGNKRWVRSICKPVVEDDRVVKLTGIMQDITRQKRDEEELRQYQHIVASSTDMLALLDTNFVFIVVNDAYANAFDKTPGEVVGLSAATLLGAEFFDSVVSIRGTRCLSGEEFRNQLWMEYPNGESKYMDVQYAPYRPLGDEICGFLVAARDITARERLQEQLVKVQKIESIGQLAGGVAHDFNNMLGIILGISELALDRTDVDESLRADLQEIYDVATRSADLTRQLLAFARKQTIVPEVLDLNETMEGMLKMMRRLIGENIDLRWRPGEGVWPLHMDPSQLDQILANLCTNARDAIDGVGEVLVETANASFDEVSCASNPALMVGEYARLTVSDNGQGMDKDTLNRIYEPFFSTKRLGQGTGLGLATVYGIVIQNNGFIDVSSELRIGTTFNIYLPRYAGKIASSVPHVTPKQKRPGHRVILLVEDEAGLLKLTTTMLKRCGYTVFPANTPSEAVRVAKAHGSEIDLLLTDVVMPEMNGRELADEISGLFPSIKTLFMSGYTADMLADKGVLDQETHFIPKPFTMQNLARSIESSLYDTLGQKA